MQKRDRLAVHEAGQLRISQKAGEVERNSLEWLRAVATKKSTFRRLSPARRAALGRLADLTGKLSLLNRQAQREGLHSVEHECEQTLDEIIRLLAVLNSPDPEGGPA